MGLTQHVFPVARVHLLRQFRRIFDIDKHHGHEADLIRLSDVLHRARLSITQAVHEDQREVREGLGAETRPIVTQFAQRLLELFDF